MRSGGPTWHLRKRTLFQRHKNHVTNHVTSCHEIITNWFCCETWLSKNFDARTGFCNEDCGSLPMTNHVHHFDPSKPSSSRFQPLQIDETERFTKCCSLIWLSSKSFYLLVNIERPWYERINTLRMIEILFGLEILFTVKAGDNILELKINHSWFGIPVENAF